MKRVLSLSVRLAAVVALIALVGCSGAKSAKVKGKVVYKGQGLPGGIVRFVPKQGKGNQTSCTIDANGNFEGEAPVGDCLVSIDNRELQGKGTGVIGASGNYNKGEQPDDKKGPSYGGPAMKGGSGPGDNRAKGPSQPPADMMKQKMQEKGAPPSAIGDKPQGKYVQIPKRYYDAASSGLEANIKSGDNALPDFTLND